MADKDTDDNKEAGTTKPAGKLGAVKAKLATLPGLFKNKKILFGSLGGLVVVVGGLGFFLFSGSSEKHKEESKAAESAAGEAAPEGNEKKEEDQAFYYELPEMTVNLSSSSQKQQYMRARIALEFKNGQMAKQMEANLPRVQDTFQVYLRELRVSDLEGSAGIQRLKEELLKRTNQIIQPLHVDSILFKEILVQ